MSDKIIARARRTFRAPRDYGNAYAFTITAEAYQLGNNQHPHFAVTGDIYHKATRTRTGDGTRACGCLHDEAEKAWPAIRPIIALHLCNADDGAPGYATENGYYWLAGAVGGLGQEYHAGSGSSAKSVDECLRILSEHLRISLAEAEQIANKVGEAYNVAFQAYEAPATGPTLNRLPPGTIERQKSASIVARNVLFDFVSAQRDRWQAEATAGLDLIRKLSQKEVKQ